MSHKAIESSGNNEWETPPYIFEHWNRMFMFDLDVCASKENAKCASYFATQEVEHSNFEDKKCVGVDALTQPWWDRNWMNPPYGRGMIEPFIAKASQEDMEGNLTVGLLPVSTSTRWWAKYVATADYIYYYKHRINFLRGGIVVKGAAFDPCIVIWGLNP